MTVHHVDYSAEDSREKFAEHLRRTGVAILDNPPTGPGQVTAIYDEWKTFFDSDSKFAYLANSDQIDGYFPPPPPGPIVRDHKEFFHIYPGGRYPTEVSAAALNYSVATRTLASELLAWLDRRLPHLVDGAEATVLRIQRYLPTPDVPVGTPRGLAHTDINMLTLLSAPSAPGLQISIGGQWFDVSANPDSMIIQAGEMLEAVSRGTYPAALHRVSGAAKAASAGAPVRMSMPLFVHAADEAVVTPGCTTAEFRQRRVAELRNRGWVVVPGGSHPDTRVD
jgi:isopenicillin N synthase-like dioxygenase